MFKNVVKILFLIIIFSRPLWAIEIEQKQDRIYIKGNFTVKLEENGSGFLHLKCKDAVYGNTAGNPNLPLLTKNYILPNEGNYTISSLDYNYDEIDLNNKIEPVLTEDNTKIDEKIYSQDSWFPQDIVQVNVPVIMRGIRFSQLTLSPVIYNPVQNKLRVIKKLNLELELDQTKSQNAIKQTNPNIAPDSFDKIAQSTVMGYSPLKNNSQKNYLFICPDACELLVNELKKWKNKLGFKVRIATLSETGTTKQEIKSYLQNAYDNWSTPPEYVILFGDVSGSFQIPTFYVNGSSISPNCATDHAYTLLQGDDYFPDILIGRISFHSQNELMTIVSKIINYEKYPYLETDWFTNALMVGYIDEFQNLYSPYETLMEVKNKLHNFNYTKVDAFISPYYTSPQQLADWINTRGYTFINYRGGGSTNYWSGAFGYGPGHLFTNENVENDLNNGELLPMITSITCGGGDFADPDYPNSFGELWLKAGSPGSPKGAIGFIGPSEHDTKTRFNNVNDMGIYQGITQEGITACGEMLLRGKMALYNNFPHAHAMGNNYNSDQFYFYVYNLLGDPGLNVWTDFPREIDFSCADTISSYDNNIQVQLNDVENQANFTLALTNEDSLIASEVTNNQGIANLLFELEPGIYELTASKYGYIPKTKELIVVQKESLQLQDFNFSQDLTPNNEITLNTSIRNNYSEIINNLKLKLISDSNYLEIVTDSILIENIEPDSAVFLNFSFITGPKWENGAKLDLLLKAENSEIETNFLIPAELAAPTISIVDIQNVFPDTFLLIGEENEINFRLKNNGSTSTDQFEISLISKDDEVEITDSISYCNNLSPGDSSLCENTFSFMLSDSLISGEKIDFDLVISKENQVVENLPFTTRAGKLESNKPTFGNCDYIAIESRDTGNFTAPEYEWVELDTALGGSGNLVKPTRQTDDGSISIYNLPKLFPFFDRFYDKISIGSNGYVCLGETERIFFRNSTIPSGAGPAAMIAPFWDKLQDGNIFTHYVTEEEVLIIEWSNFKNSYDPEKTETFQVLLYFPGSNSINDIAKSRIIFQYKEISNIDQEDNYATVGIENYAQDKGLLLSYADTLPKTMHQLQNETAILFQQESFNDLPLITTSPSEFNLSLNKNENTERTITINNLSTKSIIDYDLVFTHFSYNKINKSGLNRSLENDFIFCNSINYIAFEEDLLDFCLYHHSDSEPVRGITIDLPEFVNVIDASAIDRLSFNGETGPGASITWGFNDTLITSPGVKPFAVSIQSDINVLSPLDLIWEIEGDGTGGEPHQKEGEISIPPDTTGYFWITYPTSQDKLIYSTMDSVLWNYWGNSHEMVKLQISYDNGTSWELITESTQNDGKYEFLVDEPLSEECIIKISGLDETSYDKSAKFTITALDINYPNSNTVMEYNSTDSILWQGLGTIETVDIKLTTDGGLTWDYLTENYNNSGKFAFTVPANISHKCQIEISKSGSDVKNYSEKFFSIVDYPVEWINADSMSGRIMPETSKNITLNISTIGLETGTYNAFIKLASNFGQILYVPINLTVNDDLDPATEHLKQNRPNPVKYWTKFPFYIDSKNDDIKLKIYNIKGRLIRSLNYDTKQKEENFIFWDTKNNKGVEVKSGIYFYRLLINGKGIQTKKCMIIR